MRTLLLFLSLIILTGCKDTPSVNTPPETPVEAPKEASVERLKEDHVAADFTNFLAPLIDPSKLTRLKENEPPHHDYARPVTGSRWLIQAALTPARALTKHTLKQAHTSLRGPKLNVSPPTCIPHP